MKGVVQITCRPSNRNSSRPARKVTKGILAERLQNESLTEERSVEGLNTWGRSERKISLRLHKRCFLDHKYKNYDDWCWVVWSTPYPHFLFPLPSLHSQQATRPEWPLFPRKSQVTSAWGIAVCRWGKINLTVRAPEEEVKVFWGWRFLSDQCSLNYYKKDRLKFENVICNCWTISVRYRLVIKQTDSNRESKT